MDTIKNSNNFIGKNIRKKIHLGFYMYTPMLGGAERLLRDLLFGINREQFRVSLFYESWPEFDAFLKLNNCPALQVHPLPVLEPGGHIPTNQNGIPSQNTKFFDLHNLIVKFLADLRFLGRNYFPFWKSVRGFFGFSLSSLFFCPNLFFVYRALKNQHLDILHIINGGYPGASSAREAALAAKLAGIPICVMTICNDPIKREKFIQTIEGLFDKLVYKCVDKFIVPADSMAQSLRKYRKFGTLKTYKIPWGVPSPKSVTSSFVSDFRKHWGIPEGAKVIGTIASFVSRKGHSYLIEAISILKKNKIDNFRVVLVGEGPIKTEIQNQVELFGLKDMITFTGYRPDTPEITQIFDLFVYPSTWEGVPYSILEAMAGGKPVIATAVGGIPEVVIDGQTGIIVPPADPSALAQAIGKLLLNPELLQETGKAGLSRYEEDYTLEKMLEQHEILYGQCISETTACKK